MEWKREGWQRWRFEGEEFMWFFMFYGVLGTEKKIRR
jgi:hypothetical protein